MRTPWCCWRGTSRWLKADLPRFAKELQESAIPLREGAGAYRFFGYTTTIVISAAYLREWAATQGMRSYVTSRASVAVRPGLLPRPAYPYTSARRADRQGKDDHYSSRSSLKRHRRIYGIFRVSEARDPEEGVVDGWLSGRTYRAADQWLGPVNFVIYATPATARDWDVRPITADFEGQLTLQDYTLTPGITVPAGEIVQLRLRWQFPRKPDTDKMLFVQLLDEHDRILAQHDLPIAGVSLPEEEDAVTLVGIAIPATAAPGDYRLIVGLYDPRTSLR